MNISIVGHGFVGKSISNLCNKNNLPYNVCDTIGDHYKTIQDLISHCESDENYYFICVPTPMGTNGECDTSIVESVVGDISKYSTRRTIVYIKSTIVVGTTRRLANSFKNINIVFNPEFLRENSANQDFYDAKFVLMSSEYPLLRGGLCEKRIFKILYKHNPQIEIIVLKKYEESEIFKYIVNVFLPMKVLFFNEIYNVCEKFDIDYNNVKNLIKLDPRIGESHTTVPSFESDEHGNKLYGYAKKCFEKDVPAFIALLENIGIPNALFKTVVERNNEIRYPKPKSD